MSNPMEQRIDSVEAEVVAMTIVMDGDRQLAESIISLRNGARTIVDMAMMAMSPSECVGYPELRIA